MLNLNHPFVCMHYVYHTPYKSLGCYTINIKYACCTKQKKQWTHELIFKGHLHKYDMNKLNMLIFSLGVTRKDKIRNGSEEQLKLNGLEIKWDGLDKHTGEMVNVLVEGC